MAEAEEKISTSSYKLVCQLCDKIFEESIQSVCVHLTFCRNCFEKNGLPDHLWHGMDMVCTRCSGISVNRDQQWDSQQAILSSMHLRAKCRRGLLENCHNPAVNLLCQQLNEVVNINGSTSSSTSLSSSTPLSSSKPSSSSTPSLSGSFQPTNGGGTKPCLGFGCKTCILVEDVCSVVGSSGEAVNVDGNFTCRSKRVIYCIFCNRCKKIFIGKTTQKLQDRMSQHCRDIQEKARSSVPNHFNLEDHTIEDLRVCVIKSFNPNTSRRTLIKEKKEMMLRLGTIEPYGMNKA